MFLHRSLIKLTNGLKTLTLMLNRYPKRPAILHLWAKLDLQLEKLILTKPFPCHCFMLNNHRRELKLQARKCVPE